MSILLVVTLLFSFIAAGVYFFRQPLFESEDEELGFGTFGYIPNWLNITVEETSDFVIVDNADGFIFKFRKGTAGYNEIWQNGSLMVGDERWQLEYEFQNDTWRMRGESQSVSWEQPESYHVVVKRFYMDYEGTTFNITYDFYGGFRPKIIFEGDIGQVDNYRLVWKIAGINKTYVQDEPSKYQVKFWDEGEEEIVFDYSDVFENFGKITKVEIKEEAGNYKLTEIFNVGNLDIGEFILDPTFGYTNTGTGIWNDAMNWMRGTLFTAPESGTAQSISVYAWVMTAAKYAKCAIYRHSDLVLIGQTEELLIPAASATWRTWNFITKPNLVASTDYILMIYVQFAGGNFYLKRTDAALNTGHVKNVLYNGFPSPLSGYQHVSAKNAIYCTYAVAPTVTTQDATGVTDEVATLHGTIVSTGDENCDERGFDYDNDTSGAPYAYSWTESDSYGTGAFSHEITSLTSGTTYYFRAKAHNSAGWGYGVEKTFTTESAPVTETRTYTTTCTSGTFVTEWIIIQVFVDPTTSTTITDGTYTTETTETCTTTSVTDLSISSTTTCDTSVDSSTSSTTTCDTSVDTEETTTTTCTTSVGTDVTETTTETCTTSVETDETTTTTCDTSVDSSTSSTTTCDTSVDTEETTTTTCDTSVKSSTSSTTTCATDTDLSTSSTTTCDTSVDSSTSSTTTCDTSVDTEETTTTICETSVKSSTSSTTTCDTDTDLSTSSTTTCDTSVDSSTSSTTTCDTSVNTIETTTTICDTSVDSSTSSTTTCDTSVNTVETTTTTCDTSIKSSTSSTTFCVTSVDSSTSSTTTCATATDLSTSSTTTCDTSTILVSTSTTTCDTSVVLVSTSTTTCDTSVVLESTSTTTCDTSVDSSTFSTTTCVSITDLSTSSTTTCETSVDSSTSSTTTCETSVKSSTSSTTTCDTSVETSETTSTTCTTSIETDETTSTTCDTSVETSETTSTTCTTSVDTEETTTCETSVETSETTSTTCTTSIETNETTSTTCETSVSTSEIISTTCTTSIETVETSTTTTSTQISTSSTSTSTSTVSTIVITSTITGGQIRTQTVNAITDMAGIWDSGDVDSVNTKDGNDYIVDETGGVEDALRINWNYTNMPEFNDGHLNIFARYAGGGGHYMEVQVYHWDEPAWETIGVIEPTADSIWHNLTIEHPSHLVDGGIVLFRFIHAGGNGNPSHWMGVDFIQFIYRLNAESITTTCLTATISGTSVTTTMLTTVTSIDSTSTVTTAFTTVEYITGDEGFTNIILTVLLIAIVAVGLYYALGKR